MRLTHQITACIAMVLCSTFCFATDLTVKDIKTKEYVNVNQPLQIQFTLANINKLPAVGHVYYVQVMDNNGQQVYMEEMEGPFIEAFSELIITTYADWVPEQTGDYSITAGVMYNDDIDTSNNVLTQNTTAILPREEVVIGLEGITTVLPACDSSSASAFIPLEPLYPGDFISHTETLGAFEVQNFTWFAYYDCNPEARYAHQTYFVLIDAVDTITEIFSSTYPPVINGQNYMTSITERDTTQERILGEPQPVDTVETATTIYDDTPTTPDPTVTCAILAGGKPNDDKEALAFRSDLEYMEGNLIRESLGPQLDSNQIDFIGNASAAEICEAIENVETGYDKILFYYTGHGYHVVNDTQRYGWMVTQDPGAQQLTYTGLAIKLNTTSAKDICVIVDACYSGEAVTDFMSYFENRDKTKNITVISAANSDTTSLTHRVFVTGNGQEIWLGFFSWNFVLCYGEPMANSDDDPGISFPEAFHWVRRMNPSTASGMRMNVALDPQMWLCRTQPVVSAPASARLPDTDLSVKMRSEPAATDSVSCSMEFYKDSIGTWEDETVIDISPTRTWALEWKSGTPYSMDLEFEYDVEFDELQVSDTTEVGVVQKGSDGNWQRVTSEDVQDSNRVVVRDVDSLGLYALATVLKTTSNTTIADKLTEINLVVAPNPTAGNCTVNLTLESGASVKMDIHDMNGRVMSTLVDADLARGDHTYHVPMHQWPSGVYLCKLTVDGQTTVKEVVKVD